jgi:two-component system sensor histidine kinase VicK
MSLFIRLFLLMILAGMAPLVPTGALLFYYQSHAKTNTLALHESLSAITATSIRQYMQGLAGRMAFTESLEVSPAKQSKTVSQLNDALLANPDFLLAVLLDAQGRAVARSGGDEVLRRFGYEDHAQDPVFLQARRTGRVVFSKFDALDGKPVCSLVFPVKAHNYLYVVASAAPLWTQIQEQRNGNTGRIYLSDEQGRVFRFDGDNPPAINPAWLAGAFASKKTARLDEVPTNLGAYVGAFRKVEGLDLYVLTLQARSEAFWMLSLTSSLIIFFILAIATASYFSALYYARKLSQPITALIEGADRVTAKDFESPVESDTDWGEFSLLITTFNQMMGELGRYHHMQVDRLLEEKRKLDLLITMMRDGVILADSGGGALYYNAVAKSLLEDKHVLDRLSPGAHDAAEAIKGLCIMAAGDEHAFNVSGPGGTRWYRLARETFKPAQGGDPLLLLLLRDVTLEHELDAMKEDFFGSVAHDLRAPLLGLQGYMALLEASCKGAPEQEYLQAMKHSSARIFRLIEDILDIARMDSGTLAPKKEDFDFEECAARTIETLRPLLEEKNITASVFSSCGANRIFRGDARMLERVLGNLVSNSIKFTPQGGAITVAYCVKNDINEVRVHDTGPGIPDDKLEEIFAKYRRLENSPGKGYGLGLAIARKIVELHGGEIHAEHTDAGAEIVFTLPA